MTLVNIYLYADDAKVYKTIKNSEDNKTLQAVVNIRGSAIAEEPRHRVSVCLSVGPSVRLSVTSRVIQRWLNLGSD